jgi:hypothetical protein
MVHGDLILLYCTFIYRWFTANSAAAMSMKRSLLAVPTELYLKKGIKLKLEDYD